jgi:hypothetical protein
MVGVEDARHVDDVALMCGMGSDKDDLIASGS